jgi:hypothetical protein
MRDAAALCGIIITKNESAAGNSVRVSLQVSDARREFFGGGMIVPVEGLQVLVAGDASPDRCNVEKANRRDCLLTRRWLRAEISNEYAQSV